MKRYVPILLSIAALFIAALLAARQADAGARQQISLQEGAPTVISYQGQVTVDGSAYNGRGYFKFAIVALDGQTAWSNDGLSVGGSQPAASVPLTVTNGSFTVLLGDTTLGMGPITHVVFAKPDTNLRVWFSTDNVTFQALSPDRRIAAVPYAMQAEIAKQADMVGGYPSSQLSTLGHKHAGQDIYSGTVSAAYIDPAIARTSQITPTVWSNDGTGSGLDADLLDGRHASALRPLVATAAYTRSVDLGTSCAAYAAGTSNSQVITLTVPGPGTIIVEANTLVILSDSVDVFLAISETPDDCAVDAVYATHWFTGTPRYRLMPGGPFVYDLLRDPYTMMLTLPVRRSFAVTGAGTYTFYLNGQADAPTTDYNRWRGTDVTAQYYP
jgi:hypothetical protein